MGTTNSPPVVLTPTTGYKSQQTLVQHIRANLAAASGGQNVAQRAPLLAPPAWQASTNYVAGQVVTNSGGGAGNLYVCQIFGQSAASGGPTGQGSAFIIDNATSWQYFGPVTTPTSSALAPAVTTALISSAPAGSWFYANPLDTLNAAAPANPAFFTLEGGFWQALTAGFAGATSCIANYSQLGGGSVVANVGGIQSSFWNNGHGGSVTFVTDAPKFMIHSFSNNGSSGWIEIDDVPLSDTQTYAATAASALVLDFTAVGGRKARKVRVYCDQLHGVSVMDAVSQVWPYQPSNGYSMCWSGDSISQGSGNGPFGAGNFDAVRRFARMVGCENVCNNGVGGTGFFTAANGIYNYQISGQLFTLLSPDVIFAAGNFNDIGATSAQRLAATSSYLQYMRANFPSAMIVVFGPWGGSHNGDAAIRSAEADLQTAVTQFNDANTFFIPLIARTPNFPWISGTGRVSAQSGTGNADIYVGSDGIHPICLAHKEYIPRVYAEAFKSLINSLS